MLWFKPDAYPSFRDLTDMGYSKEEARNILAMVDAGANDPQVVWQMAKDGVRK